MAYIIENANLLKSKGVSKTSILIKDEKIAAIRPQFKKYTYMKMNADPFIMTPPHVILDSQIPLEKPFHDMKEYYIDHFIKNGCTTFITYVSVDKEYLLESSRKEILKKLVNSPIDYIIGMKTPLRLLTPAMIRKSKKGKFPVIFVEISEAEEIEQIPWGWIKEAMFPYNSPLSPIFMNRSNRELERAKMAWNKMVKKERVPAIEDEITEGSAISLSILKKIGIYPIKSFLEQGGEVSYNLYSNGREIRKIEEFDLFHYYKHRLTCTIHKGTIIRAGEEVLFRPGFGEHVLIKTPLFFSAD